MNDEIDWDDIESRLYSQVYHASVENDQLRTPISSTTTDTLQNNSHAVDTVMRHNNRYFHRRSEIVNPPIYISLENKNVTTSEVIYNSQNNLTFKPNSTVLNIEGNLANQFQNNITVNQYTIPIITNSELNESNTGASGRCFNSWSTENQKLLDKRNRRRLKRLEKRRAKNKEKRLDNKQNTINSLIVEVNLNENVLENVQRTVSDVICISDDCGSDDNMENKELKKADIPTGFPKKYNELDINSKKPESDDDIIYIPPPPVEVINVDTEEIAGKAKVGNETVAKAEENFPQTTKKLEKVKSNSYEQSRNLSNFSSPSMKLSPNKRNYNPRECTELLCTPEATGANDFLENVSFENNTNKFNFSLHGSEFNSSQGDFVRPANPVEFCETESSCSTNDYNRDLGNTVKTVVFDEVEFPREDIFSEQNLESFSTYITPKRKMNQKSKATNSAISTAKNLHDTSSDSSSDSDSEHSNSENENLKKFNLEFRKLPNLSPMQLGDSVTPKKKSKMKTGRESIKNHLLPNDSPQIKTGSKKRKSDVIEISESDTDTDEEYRKTQPKRKHKMSKSIEVGINEGKKKKKIVSPLSNLSESDAGSSYSQKKKKKQQTLKKDSTSQNKPKNKNRRTSLEKYDDKEVVNDENILITSQNFKNKNTQGEENAGDILENISEKKQKHLELRTTDTENEKKKKNSPDSRCDGENIVEINPETAVRKKRNSSSDRKSSKSDETIRETIITEMPKKKKKKTYSSEGSERGSGIIEKQQKRETDYSSNSSHKSLDSSEAEDQIIDVVTVDKCDQDSDRDNKSESKLSGPHKNSNHFPEITIEGSNKKTSDENTTDTLLNAAEITAVQETEADSSKEEIIVDDEADSSMSSLIVVDEVNSSVIETDIPVLLSSDSEDGFKGLGAMGKDLELANCSLKTDRASSSQELIVVDDNSGSNFSNRRILENSGFDVEAIQRTQSDDPEMWKISHKDRALYLNIGKSKGPRCNKCRQFGHIAVRCSEKTDGPKCSLCGTPGHLEPRCPRKMCRQCGNAGDFSTFCWKCFKFRSMVCTICCMKGHVADTCPDLWRRYHLTTEEGPIVVSQAPQLKPRDQQWCSGCAKNGHLEHECSYYNREYPPANPGIVSYEDVLHQGNTSRLPLEIVNYPSQNNLSSQEVPSTPFNTLPNAPFKTIPSLMSLKIPPPTDLNQNKSVVVHTSMNCVIEVPNKSVVSGFSSDNPHISTKSASCPMLDQMMQNYLSEYSSTSSQEMHRLIDPRKVKQGIRELCKNDQRRVKHIIMSMPSHRVKQFLKREMADLEDVAIQSDPRYLKKKIFKCDGLSKSKKFLKFEALREKCFWYRILNMFIFGAHKFRDGNLHFNYLSKYLSGPKRNKLDVHTRKSLFNAYSYIFGVSRHVNLNYYKALQLIIEGCDEDKF